MKSSVQIQTDIFLKIFHLKQEKISKNHLIFPPNQIPHHERIHVVKEKIPRYYKNIFYL